VKIDFWNVSILHASSYDTWSSIFVYILVPEMRVLLFLFYHYKYICIFVTINKTLY